jgi:hypothetical protein
VPLSRALANAAYSSPPSVARIAASSRTRDDNCFNANGNFDSVIARVVDDDVVDVDDDEKKCHGNGHAGL